MHGRAMDAPAVARTLGVRAMVLLCIAVSAALGFSVPNAAPLAKSPAARGFHGPLSLRMVDNDSSKRAPALLGSRRLRKVRDMLQVDPSVLDESETFMGSRRMAKTVEILMKGATDKAHKIAEKGPDAPAVVAEPVEKTPAAAADVEAEMTDSVENSIEVDATPAECYQVAAKLDDYPKWVGSLESVEVLDAGSDGLAKQAKFAVGAFGQTLDYTLEYTHAVPERLAWKAVAGSVKALVGSYTFEALDGGKRTRVTYKLALDPGFSIPSMIKKASTKLIVSTALSDLRKYTERPATKELVRPLVERAGGTGAAAVSPAVEKVEAEMTDSVENSIEIDASPEMCYQVAAKLDDYPKWVGSLESVEVLDAGSDGLAKQAKFAVGAFGQTLDYTLEYTHAVPERLAWKAVAGSVKALVGSYTFEALDGGKRTRVTYKLALDPGFSIPGMIKKASTKLIVSTALSDLRKYTERPETQERMQKTLDSRGVSQLVDSIEQDTALPILIDSVKSDIVVDASPSEVYQIAADFENYKQWVGSLQSCKKLDSDPQGLGTRAEFTVGAFGQTLDYTLAYTHDFPRRMSWKAVAGTVKSLVGAYSFDAVGDGSQTRVTYELALDPGFPVPAWVKTATTKLIVSSALRGLKDYSESPATKAMTSSMKPILPTENGLGSEEVMDEHVEMTDSVENSIEVDATPAECYQVAAKLDDYPKWVGSLESVEVLDAGSDGLAKQAKFAVGAFGQTLDYTLEYTHAVPERLAWKAVAGSVKALVGSYTFEALDGGKRTRVTYKLALDPGFSIPSMIKKASTKLIVSTALSDLRKYTERPATKELVRPLVERAGGTGAAAVSPAVEKVEAEMTDSVENSIEIDASPEMCYQVAAKLDDYPKWVGSLESVEVLDAGSDGLAKQAKFAVGAFGQTLDYTLEYTHAVPERLAWKAVAGSVKALVGSYTFEALDGGKRTRVTYKLALDPGFSIPGMIKKASTKLIVSTALSDLRKYTERTAK